VIKYFDEKAIRNQLLADLGRLKGVVNRRTRGQVIQAVRRARTLSEVDRELIEHALRGR
jgi:hypothetical protein